MDSMNPYSPPAVDVAVERVSALPKTFSEVFLSGTKLFIWRFPAVLGVTALIWGPAELLLSYSEYYVFDAEDLNSVLLAQSLAQAIVGIIAMAAVVHLGCSTLLGHPLSWHESLVKGLFAWPRLFVTNLLEGILLCLALLAMVLPFFYFAVRFSLAATIAILERKSGMQALNRSKALTHGKFLWFLCLCTVTTVPLILLSLVAYFPVLLLPIDGQWLASAAVSFVLDLVVHWTTLVFVAAYVSVYEPSEQDVETGSRHGGGGMVRRVRVKL